MNLPAHRVKKYHFSPQHFVYRPDKFLVCLELGKIFKG